MKDQILYGKDLRSLKKFMADKTSVFPKAKKITNKSVDRNVSELSHDEIRELMEIVQIEQDRLDVELHGDGVYHELVNYSTSLWFLKVPLDKEAKRRSQIEY